MPPAMSMPWAPQKVEKGARAEKEVRRETRVERAKEDPKVVQEEEVSNATCRSLPLEAVSFVESPIGPSIAINIGRTKARSVP